MAQVSYSKGFVVNSSISNAQSLDVSKGNSDSSSLLLNALVEATRQEEEKVRAAKLKESSEKALVKSLEDGSAFAPSYKKSYTDGYYAGGSYGSFGKGASSSADPDSVLVKVISQGQKNPSAILDSEPRRSPSVQAPSTEPTWKDIVKQYKWWIIGALAAVLYFVFRRQN